MYSIYSNVLYVLNVLNVLLNKYHNIIHVEVYRDIVIFVQNGPRQLINDIKF